MEAQIGYIVSRQDNVATALQDIARGAVRLTGAVPEGLSVSALSDIPFGHKVALYDIKCGENIVKYGAVIGIATADIAKGEYVHLHNMRSRYDDYSSTFDPDTADDPEMEYELYEYE